MLPGFIFPSGQPPLKDLSGSSSATGGQAWSYVLANRTPGSKIEATNGDGQVVGFNSGTNTLSSSFGQSNHVATVTVTETLAGSPNSPRVSTINVAVSYAAPFTLPTRNGGHIGQLVRNMETIFTSNKDSRTFINMIATNMPSGGSITMTGQEQGSTSFQVHLYPSTAVPGAYSGSFTINESGGGATNPQTATYTFDVPAA